MAWSSDAFGYISRNGHPRTSLIPVLVFYHFHGNNNNVFVLFNSLLSRSCRYLSCCVFMSEEGLLSSSPSEKTEPMRSPQPAITGYF